jgi:hypothetical protein
MRPACKATLLFRAFWEMARYDAICTAFGFPGVRKRMKRRPDSLRRAVAVESVCEAIGCMSSFYWKPLPCLQRSIVTARLLRAMGVQADVVIGYRANPFFSHAWVEVDGRVVNDSPAYQTKLQLLDRF